MQWREGGREERRFAMFSGMRNEHSEEGCTVLCDCSTGVLYWLADVSDNKDYMRVLVKRGTPKGNLSQL